jgi:predicted PurR-regulated permease PerM
MPETIRFNRSRLSRNIAYAAIHIFALFLLYQLSDFITPFLGALIFYVLFTPFMIKLTADRGWKKEWAALVIILFSLFIVLIPILLLSYLLYAKVNEVISNHEAIMELFSNLNQRVFELAGVELITNENIKSLQSAFAELVPSLLGQSLYLLGNIAMMYFMLYYMLTNIEWIKNAMNTYLPLGIENIQLLAAELKSMTVSNAIGVPLVAITQGIAAGIGYYFFGLSDPVFWAVITAFVSILPVVGTTLVWAPAGIYLLATQSVMMGVGLLIYGVLVVINIDNVARLMIQKKFADVHPAITIFGVIIGLNLFGLPGLIFGPLMLSYFVMFIKMYRKVYAGGGDDEITERGQPS